MKRRILGLVLTFVMFVALVVPGAAALAVYNPAAVGSYTLANYDVRYVTQQGSDITGAGTTQADAWRTITYALSKLPYTDTSKPDLIWVGESAPLYYGGPGAVAENIEVRKGDVVIWAPKGAEKTIINVAGQESHDTVVVGPDAVVEIYEPNVIIDGFTLMGAPTGVFAEPDEADEYPATTGNQPYLDEVKILNCVIKTSDENRWATGIDMVDVKNPTINNNYIKVVCTCEADGIEVEREFDDSDYIGFKAVITNNLLDIQGNREAEGIFLGGYPNHSVIDNNTVNVLAGLDVFGSGIEVEDSPLVQITNNTVNVTATGNTWTVDYGIKVRDCDKANIATNQVSVAANMVGNIFGFLFARGIVVKDSNQSTVTSNNVQVVGTANANNTTVLELASVLGADELEDLADLTNLTTQTDGQLGNWSAACGTVIGIKVKGSEDVQVLNNAVNPVKLDLFVRASDNQTAAAGAAGFAAGIVACGSGSPELLAQGNTVAATANVKLVADTIKDQDALGGAISVAFGIALDGCEDSKVLNNPSVSANAVLDADVRSVTTVTQDATSGLARFDAEIIGAINAALTDVSQSESIGVTFSGDVASINSVAASGVIAAGIGVGVLDSDRTKVDGNTVLGAADLDSDVWARSASAEPVGALGAGLGLGAAIAVLDSRSVEVCNNIVTGVGTADATVGAQHDSGATGHTFAAGCSAGIGVGIVLCGADSYPSEAVEGQVWSFRPVVANNRVSATGVADEEVSANDLVKSHDSCATGESLGLSIGIGAFWYPCILIKDNDVNATGSAEVNTDATAIHTVDPLSSGAAAGVGLGIATVACPGADIEGNETVGKGDAFADIGATENAIITDANACGSAIGLGEGIFVAYSPCVLVTGNSVAQGFGDATANVEAESYIPAGYASALGLAVGYGNGIGIFQSPLGKVVDCNTAAGLGTACVTAVTGDTDFGDDDKLAVEVSVDILWSLIDHGNFTWEASRDLWSGMVNYNSMVDTGEY